MQSKGAVSLLLCFSGDAPVEHFYRAVVLFCARPGSASLLSILVLSTAASKGQASARERFLQYRSTISDSSVCFISVFNYSLCDKKDSAFLLVSGPTYLSAYNYERMSEASE